MIILIDEVMLKQIIGTTTEQLAKLIVVVRPDGTAYIHKNAYGKMGEVSDNEILGEIDRHFLYLFNPNTIYP